MASRDEQIALELLRLLEDMGAEPVSLKQLTHAIETGDIELIAKLLGVDESYLSPVLEKLLQSYTDSGGMILAAFPATIVGTFTFGLANEAAMRYITNKRESLIKGIVGERLETIRAVLREVYLAGGGPAKAIPLLAGRVGPGGVRSGGLISLTPAQASWVIRARAELSGPYPSKSFLMREARNRRYDGLIKRLIGEKKPLTEKQINSITDDYRSRMLSVRAYSIARTEFHEATQSASYESVKALIESGRIREEDIEKVWSSSGNDGRTRHTHLSLDGQVQRFSDPFISPSGARLMFPGDRSLGAGPEERIQCRCVCNFRLRRSRRNEV